MRIFTTMLLILTTTLLAAKYVSMLVEQSREGTLEYNEVKQENTTLYTDEDIAGASQIVLTNSKNIPYKFNINPYTRQWVCSEPYQDRVDAYYIGPIDLFTTGALIVDSIPLKGIDLEKYGLNKDWVEVKFNDSKGNNLVSYKVGMSSNWRKRIITEDEKLQRTAKDYPTVFVIKENAIDDKVLYLVSDPTLEIHKLFANDFEGFRDHHPFALNIVNLEQIRIKRANSEIVIDKSTPTSPWTISKPLYLSTDTESIKSLFVGISKLTAVKLHPKGSITLPEDSKDKFFIATKNRGFEEETVLTIYPAEDNSATAYATISDRPNIIFELPVQPLEAGQSSLAIVPSSINEIRNKNMLTLNRKNIAKVIIRPDFKKPILISKANPRDKYKLFKADRTIHNINELNFNNLIDAISVLPVKAFTSDAATDLSAYGFANPSLEVNIVPFQGPIQRLTFAQKEGKIYANKARSTVVWEVDPIVYESIVTNEYEWKDNTIWLLLINDITSFSIQKKGEEKLTVHYDYFGDSFTATRGTKDVSAQLSPIQAKFFLNNSHYITTRKRLGPDHTLAKKALEKPLLSATISSAIYGNDGRKSDKTQDRTIHFASPSATNLHPPFYYAKVEGEDDYLSVSPIIYNYFALDLFNDE